MRIALGLPVLALTLVLGACTRIAGVVEQAPGRPLTSAVLSVGRPDGIAVYATHHVDGRGRFDFQLAPTDESDLYIYDAAGDPRLTLRRINRSEIGQHMHIEMHSANPNVDMGPGTP